jgi:hypothetical protein
LNHTVFDDFIKLNRQALTAVDLNNRTLQTKHACYCFMPHLAWVEDLSSDVQVRQKYHWYIRESVVLHGTGMNQILEQTALIIAYQNRTKSDNHLQNLLFLVRFYQEHLPGITIVVVEQDSEPTLTRDQLPQCRYVFIRNDGPLDRTAGMERTDHRFLIFSDSDVFIEEWDIRGNLGMCKRYDGATGFRSMANLTEEATRMLRTSTPMILTPWFDANDYSRREKRDVFDKFCVFSRTGLGEREPRLFQSPNDALQMV